MQAGLVVVIKSQKIRKDIRMKQREIIKNRDCSYFTSSQEKNKSVKIIIHNSTDIITKSFTE